LERKGKQEQEKKDKGGRRNFTDLTVFLHILRPLSLVKASIVLTYLSNFGKNNFNPFMI